MQRLVYLFKISFLPWKTRSLHQLGVVFSLTLILILFGAVGILFESTKKMENVYKNKSQITLFFEKADHTEDSIRIQLSSAQSVKSLDISDLGIAKTSSEYALLQSTAPQIFSIEGVVNAEQKEALQKISGFIEMDEAKNRYEPLFHQAKELRWISIGFILVLFLVSLSLVGLISRLNTESFRDSDRWMQTLGARVLDFSMPRILYVLVLTMVPCFISAFFLSSTRSLWVQWSALPPNTWVPAWGLGVLFLVLSGSIAHRKTV